VRRPFASRGFLTPLRFVESELDLDEELKRLHAVAAAPELYPHIVKLGSLTSIIQLLVHENVGA
jgi:beta-catenin-like protein 1